MGHSPLADVWRALSASVFEEMEGWRQEHPQATFKEIEEELDARLSGLRAHMLVDLAQHSEKRDWSGQEQGQRPRCPHCGMPLQARGKHERILSTQGGKDVKLSRSYGTCPQCGSGFFPLDEELDLPCSGLTPHAHQGLLLLGAVVPFAQAAKHLQTLLGVRVSTSTVRRLTEEAGTCLQQWQDQQAHPLTGSSSQEPVHSRLALATDGVLVPIRPKEWAEVKMVTIAEVREGKKKQVAHGEHLSYFARLSDANTFADLASYEMRRRGVERAGEVAALQDGAEWIQSFVQGHRADAIRILDFAHAAQYVSELGELARSQGAVLSASWLQEQLQTLKQQGPRTVLATLEQLCLTFAAPDMHEKLRYLRKREGQMDSPTYQRAGWPIGSGMAESGNKLVVQARLKGAGMHWKRENVNPMLALRTTLGSDRWLQGWHLIRGGWHQSRQTRASQRRAAGVVRAKTRLWLTWLRLPLPLLLACFPSPPAPPRPVSPKGRTQAQRRWGRNVVRPWGS
ncbi:ISKra4 family transposase [Ktedonospora formicarum]|uniref:ISKra4 family transposase n=1 Tax=Ktedonospora formicarum TaxID=2778364 RepID=UPI001C68E6BB|nr:ISKra4 family transposase [Ktedonospora formicarum]